jgi:hypothetical protein
MFISKFVVLDVGNSRSAGYAGRTSKKKRKIGQGCGRVDGLNEGI